MYVRLYPPQVTKGLGNISALVIWLFPNAQNTGHPFNPVRRYSRSYTCTLPYDEKIVHTFPMNTGVEISRAYTYTRRMISPFISHSFLQVLRVYQRSKVPQHFHHGEGSEDVLP